jgi:hypothetical protein
MIRRFLIAALFVSALAAGSPAHAGCADAPIKMRAPTLSTGDERSLETRFRKSLAQFCDWWGPSFEGPFTLDVEENRGPSMALLPAWRGNRGRVLFRGATVRRGQAAIAHEVVHVLAPNANRLLAEGLAVYIHDLFQAEPAFPNFGSDLTAEARKLLDRADIAALDRLATPSRLQLDGLNSRDAYIVAGSFVGFLIERHGLRQFRRLYATTPLVERESNAGAPDRWRRIYGISLKNFTTEWRIRLEG